MDLDPMALNPVDLDRMDLGHESLVGLFGGLGGLEGLLLCLHLHT